MCTTCIKKISFEKRKKEKNTIYIRSLGYHYTRPLPHRLFYRSRIFLQILNISNDMLSESSLKEFPHRTTVRCNRIYDHLEIVQYFLLFYFMQQGSIVMKSLRVENSGKDKRENKELR